MKNAVLVLSLALAGSARAGLLVTPTFMSGEYQIARFTEGEEPSTSGNYRERDGSGAFASGGSSGGNIFQGTILRAGAGFTNEYFLTISPLANVDYARLRGTADTIVRVDTEFPGVRQATAVSRARIEFDVTQEVQYDLTGLLATGGVLAVGPGSGMTHVGVKLLRNQTVYGGINFSLFEFGDSVMPLNFSGTMTTGHYILECFAFSAADGDIGWSHWSSRAEYDVRLDFSPVPAPGTVSLLLLGLAMTRRRR